MKKIFLLFSIIFLTLIPVKVKAIEYKVDFFDGENNNIITVEENQVVNKPEDPSKEGYKFLYWINRKTLQEFDFNTKITEDVRLIAEWKQSEVDMQKDVAKMITSDKKDNDVFGIMDKDKETIWDRLLDLKILIPLIIMLLIGLILLIIFIIKKVKNKIINNKQVENKIIICRFCGQELKIDNEECPNCKTIVIRK